ncbi:hypothetical protein ENC_24930 [Enterobacter hormaechei]|nr:hypothetical protein ENC_24930 [Enterobacter hormaechei]
MNGNEISSSFRAISPSAEPKTVPPMRSKARSQFLAQVFFRSFFPTDDFPFFSLKTHPIRLKIDAFCLASIQEYDQSLL